METEREVYYVLQPQHHSGCYVSAPISHMCSWDLVQCLDHATAYDTADDARTARARAPWVCSVVRIEVERTLTWVED